MRERVCLQIRSFYLRFDGGDWQMDSTGWQIGIAGPVSASNIW